MSYYVLTNTLRGLRGIGAAEGCVPVVWTNQLGGSGTNSLCPSGPTCGDVAAFQQTMKDLGYYVEVTGQWDSQKDLQALAQWRKDNGLQVHYQGPSPSECAMLVAQRSQASAAPAPTAPSPSASTSRFVSLARASAIRTAVAPAVASRVTLRPVKASQSAPTPDEGELAPVDEAAPTEDGSLSVGFDFAGWWGRMSTVQKAAVVGGGVILVGGIAYLALA